MAKRKKDSAGRTIPGKCIFCDGFGLSKEHVWSDWLKDVLPSTPHYDTWWRANTIDFSDWSPSFETSVRRRPGPLRSLKKRVVCQKCNREWMSTVVSRAKSAAREMILGSAIRLSRDEMTNIATWV